MHALCHIMHALHLHIMHAGYAAGDRPIPDVAVVSDVVRDHGAKGDNSTDDTQAFLEGIKVGRG